MKLSHLLKSCKYVRIYPFFVAEMASSKRLMLTIFFKTRKVIKFGAFF